MAEETRDGAGDASADAGGTTDSSADANGAAGVESDTRAVPAQVRETPATFALLATLLVVFVAGRAARVRAGTDAVALLAVQSDQLGRVWTPLTSVFLHVVPVHLLANGAFLYWWGSGAERAYGSRVFAAVFLCTGVGSAVLGAALDGVLTCRSAAFAAGGCRAVAGGASGALLGAVGYSTARDPSFRVRPFPGVELPLWAFAGVIGVASLLGTVAPVDPLSALLGFPVKHEVHLVGLALGVALGFGWRPDE